MVDAKSFNGRIIEEQKNYFLISCNSEIFRASIRGLFRKANYKLQVGDSVDFQILNEDRIDAQIVTVRPRTNVLTRPPVSNLSQLIVVCSFTEPQLDLEVVDRFLFYASVLELTAHLVINKSDLAKSAQQQEHLESVEALYRTLGYQVVRASAVSSHGIEEIKNLCIDTISAFAGPSGVGKSSLLANIFPEREFRTAEVSAATKRGTHTTTSVTLLPLGQGGYIADTPGFSLIEMPEIDESETGHHFPELLERLGQCRYNNCSHENEPGCVIKDLIENGTIAKSRFEHFLKIYKEIKSARQQYRKGKK